MRNQLYTFFLDYKGGTYVSQVKASSPVKALMVWTETLDDTNVDGLSHSAKKKLIRRSAPIVAAAAARIFRFRLLITIP